MFKPGKILKQKTLNSKISILNFKILKIKKSKPQAPKTQQALKSNILKLNFNIS